MDNEEILLEVKGLKTYFKDSRGLVPAVDGVDFILHKGETLGIVGESGCGKSMTAMSILHLLPPKGEIVDGSIQFKGQDITHLPPKEMARLRGKEIAMIFQEPMTSLNPVYTVGWQISEMILRHESMTKKQAKEKAIEMLRLVNIPAPEKRVDEYPHELSGGMRQRVMIAMALSCNPELLIADEPTTALDVTIQAQILDLMRNLKKSLNTSIIMITHDLGVVAEMSDYVLVMYAGMVMEYSDVATLFQQPLHPYTQGLMKALPRLDDPQDKLYVIKGAVPSLYHLPAGCRFWPRCPYATERCKQEMPGLYQIGERKVRCFRYENGMKEGALNE
ncbi:ABC transporter ATP-binding protein [Pseudoflavonifractor capillosus]|uniref:ABC transporter ATP-binding protein n=1 Tax=Pseudoflavonifractor capillosus TaxID=106588 RepID=UPI001956CF4D|nr:ABC transporter ATP-binding protein [Pseudoflavonifractor capillosus]MBM6681640.1 ABC transporter ATP-binding protein [Pseudoflavonifractor capillosus]